MSVGIVHRHGSSAGTDGHRSETSEETRNARYEHSKPLPRRESRISSLAAASKGTKPTETPAASTPPTDDASATANIDSESRRAITKAASNLTTLSPVQHTFSPSSRNDRQGSDRSRRSEESADLGDQSRRVTRATAIIANENQRDRKAHDDVHART